MEPVTTIMGNKALSVIGEKVQEFVIKRWTRRRAEEFYQAFVREMQKEISGDPTAEVDVYVDKILADEAKSEVLYEAYRGVALSKSKTLGPRIIGLLTARIVAENRFANWNEEKVFAAAETLSDFELTELRDHMRTIWKFEPTDKDERRFYENAHRVNADTGGTLSMTPPDLEEVGSWATKLRNLGMLRQHSEQQDQRAPMNWGSFSSLEGPTTVKFYVTVSRACDLLADYVDRAEGLTVVNEKAPE